MSGYKGLDDKDTKVFIVSDVKDFLQRLDNEETFVAYFGFSDCPWCNDAISILNSEALKEGINIYYINTRPNQSVKANCEIPDYDLLLARVGQHFGKNEEGNEYLYVPFVFFIKNGSIVYTHQGTSDSYDPTVTDIPLATIDELKEIYHHGFDLMN